MSTSYTEAWRPGPLATQFYTRKYTPPDGTSTRAVIVFVHGFAEHIARYIHFHPRLASKGIAVFAYDQRGFGLTAQDTEGNKSKTSAYGKTCWKDQMLDIAWAIGEARKAFPGIPVVLMGHSMVRVPHELLLQFAWTVHHREEEKHSVSLVKVKKGISAQHSNMSRPSSPRALSFTKANQPLKLFVGWGPRLGLWLRTLS